MGKRGPKPGDRQRKMDEAFARGKSEGYRSGFSAAWAVRGIVIGLVGTVIFKVVAMSMGWAHPDLIAGGAGMASAVATVGVGALTS